MVLNEFSFSNSLSAKRCTSKLCAGAVNGEEGLCPETGLRLLFRTWASLGGPWVPTSSDSAPPLKPIACLYDRIDKVVFVMFDVFEYSCSVSIPVLFFVNLF